MTDKTPWLEHGLTAEEYDRIVCLMKREPNYTELSLFGVMWSEHCSYKNSRAQLKKLPTTGPQVVQGPGENAGVADLGDGLGVAFKMESHNHPSAIDPYNGAATGVGGVVRDVFAMGARPVAACNSLRFGSLSEARTRWLLKGAVEGMADYARGLHSPTAAGEVYFHPGYQGNPLVNAMCLGLVENDKIFKGAATGVGNVVMVVGAPTGRDGIKGASFASEEFSSQDDEASRPIMVVGDPHLEKRLLEATLEVLGKKLAVGLQDLGAAGLTSSGSEMAGRAGNGLYIDVALTPLREEGMEPWEIMLSESQERMLLVVHPDKVEEIQAVFKKYDLPATAIGLVTGDGHFTVKKGAQVVASVPAGLLTDQAPVNIRPWSEPAYFQEKQQADVSAVKNYGDYTLLLKRLLASANICGKSWIFNQFQQNDQLVAGPGGDAAILRLPDGKKGLAVSCDCNSRYVYLNPRLGGAIAVAEAARNVACTGAKPLALTNCLNFGNPENPEIYWQFVQATDGLADAAVALDTPVTGGNVSFYNEFNGEAIPPTPAIGMVGVISDVSLRVPSSFQHEGDTVLIIGQTNEELGASEAHFLLTGRDEGQVPALDLKMAKALNDFLVEAAQNRLLSSAHDLAEGGLAVALAECCIGHGFGADMSWQLENLSAPAALFGESQSRVVISVAQENLVALGELAKKYDLPLLALGRVGGRNLKLTLASEDGCRCAGAELDIAVSELADIYNQSLPAQMAEECGVSL